MPLPSLILMLLVILMHIAANTAQPEAVSPVGSSCANLVAVVPERWITAMNLAPSAKATSNPFWCCKVHRDAVSTVAFLTDSENSQLVVKVHHNSIFRMSPAKKHSFKEFPQWQRPGVAASKLDNLRNLVTYIFSPSDPFLHSDLSQRELSGPLPNVLGNLSQSTTLLPISYLGENQLSGEIPGVLGFWHLTHSDNLFPTFAIVAVSVCGIITINFIVAIFYMKEVHIKTVKKLRYLKDNVRKIMEMSWHQPSYEYRNMRFVRLPVAVIFQLLRSNIPSVLGNFPASSLTKTATYHAMKDDPAGNLIRSSLPEGEEPPNPFYLVNALDQFFTQADSTPAPNRNVSRMIITITTIDPERHIDVINMDGYDLRKIDDNTEASVPIMRGYINKMQFITSTCQVSPGLCTKIRLSSLFARKFVLDQKETWIYMEEVFMSKILFHLDLDLIVKFTFLLQKNPIDFVTEVITDKATYTLL
ncbi:hypothetical protein BDK51DRAFT_31567 [Blyttiomyces helicus]|uniref:Uncharacterized protein n=1 Tax=Blyttiomyces helicus TaxID=388810 RepID=A0A4P9WPF7_9FUNG|nr:hypothetical protein BDK51DRAFT_31567 [Blyttiomyces helicus]|eukprot:RKO94205.1 hypothetical protein BDK51DRAFT_31567 [Blyttiomyces helicus]